jgi:peroxiredoxin
MAHLRGIASLLWLVTFCVGGCGGAQTGGPATGYAPDFTLPDIAGRWVRLSDHLGKDVVLINFWATWCAPCASELPHLERLYQTYKGQGFVILGVAMDGPESVAEVAPQARRYGLTYPVLLDEETRVVGVLNPRRAAPYNVLIGRDGSIVSTKEGYSAGDEIALEAAVQKHLGARPAGG